MSNAKRVTHGEVKEPIQVGEFVFEPVDADAEQWDRWRVTRGDGWWIEGLSYRVAFIRAFGRGPAWWERPALVAR